MINFSRTRERATDQKSVIYWLHTSDNVHRFSLTGKTGRSKKLTEMPLPERVDCPECPRDVFKLAEPRIDDWKEFLDEVIVDFKPNVSREIPDRLSYQNFTIVSDRCRSFFETEDATAGHLFLPAQLLHTDLTEIPGQWYYMWCGRIYGAKEVQHTSNLEQDVSVKGIHYKRMLATPDRCAFFEKMPVWTIGGSSGPKYLSDDIFKKIKGEGLTGFREFTHRNGFDLMSDDDTWAKVATPQNVSHIWF